MVLWLLGAGLIGFLVWIGVAAAQDPEAGFGPRDLPTLIRVRPSFLDVRQAEVYELVAERIARRGLLLFPRVLISTIFDAGRITPTGWHRMRNNPVDFVLVRARTFEPVALMVLEGMARGHYLEEENRQMKEDAIIESGLPMLKIGVAPDRSLGDSAEGVLEWLDRVVLPGADHSEGSRTQVDLL